MNYEDFAALEGYFKVHIHDYAHYRAECVRCGRSWKIRRRGRYPLEHLLHHGKAHQSEISHV